MDTGDLGSTPDSALREKKKKMTFIEHYSVQMLY